MDSNKIGYLDFGRRLCSSAPGDEVAISGMSGSLPESYNVREFAKNLYEKKNMVTNDNRRWGKTFFYTPKYSGKLMNIKRFDTGFFGLHYKQAHASDVMVRVALEKAIEAVIDAGINPKDLEGSRTGVFVAASCSELEVILTKTITNQNLPIITGTTRSMIANRVSYFLKLNGPSHVLDTACSSSFYAVECAYLAIKQGKCDQALVLCTNVCLEPGVTLQFYKLGILNTDGKTKVFDEKANGYTRSESCCAFLLQKAKDCKRIYAEIVHAKTNCDGFKTEGITFPSSDIQSVLLHDFYNECQVNIEDLTYFEAHGTGTTIGDPVEMSAIDKAIISKRKNPLLIGSVKSNVGHSEPSAGLTSIIKVILAMENELIPPNINLEKPKSNMKPINEGRAKVVVEPTKLPNQKGLMGINGFGFGGANGHILLRWNKKKVKNCKDGLSRLVCVSARIQEGMDFALDDIKMNNSNYEYLGLLHEVFKYNIDGFYYRGFSIVNGNGEVQRYSHLLKGKSKTTLWFGDLKESWLSLLCDLIKLPIIEETLRKIDMVLFKKGINFLRSVLKGERSVQEKTGFGEFITKLVVASALKTIDCNFDYYQETGENQLILHYISGQITLEEAVNYFYEGSERFNDKNKDINGIDNKVSVSNGVIRERLLISNNKIFEIGSGFKGIPDASLRGIKSGNGLVSFLEFLGKAYMFGVSMNLCNLYPLVKYPVSRGTPSISPLLKWNWQMEIPIFKYTLPNITVITFPIEVKTDDWAYLLGHIIDGRNLFPAIGYLYLVWETIQHSEGNESEDMTIIFTNCKFIRATYISPDKLTMLVVNINANKFQVLEDTTVLVTGEIRTEKQRNVKLNSIDNVEMIDHSEKSVILNENDVYKELRLRGYNYCNEFKRIKEYDMIHGRGRIGWDGNWVAFIDNMLQMMILEQDTRSLFVPTGIKYLEINKAKHYNAAKGRSDMVVEINRKSNSIRSGGIEIRNLVASSIPRKREGTDPVLEKYEFIPNECDLPLEEAMRVNVQMIVENWSDNKFKTLEYIHNTSVQNIQLISPSINNVISDLPLLQADLTVVSKSDIPATEGVAKIYELPKEGSYVLVIAQGFFQDVKVQGELMNLVADSGFILSRESVKFDPNEIKSESLQIITVYRVAQETLVLLRNISKNLQEKTHTIDVSDTTNFEWLPELQKLTEDDNANIVVYTKGVQENGVLGLVNCFRREPNSKKFQALLVEDGAAPEVSLKDSFYLNQLNKGLGINVYKNGKWGTYRHLLLEKNSLVDTDNSFVKILQWGNLSSLTWVEGDETNKMKRNSELFTVYYMALNFRDVMLASGRINYNVITRNRLLHDKLLGFEFVGRDTKGERVMGILNEGGFSTIQNNVSYKWKIPDTWSMEEAVTVPCVYATVIYALFMRGNAKPGERILIHSGTGGVGLSAIHICQYFGLEIFTTVGTEEKRAYLKKHFPNIPDDHIGNSRDTSFEEMVNLGTKGKGVDMVLNSLAEEKLLASVRCLAHGGRFLEIGKFDLANDNALQMELMNFGRSYYGIMLDRLFEGSEEERKPLHDLFQDFLNKGIIKPLDRTVFAENEIEKAMRYMTTGKHIGKVILKLREEENRKIVPKVEMKVKPVLPRYTSVPEKVTIILGGLGGFGLELADWLVLRGVRKLVLTSRNGISTGYQKYRVHIWQKYGCEIYISTANTTTKNGCEQLIKEAEKLGPIQSIFNLAVVLEDAIFDNQSVEKFKISLAPKAYATKYLDEITRKRCKDLRDFVVFSSVSCGRGNAGQTNYGMANSIMERICERRKQDGLPALAIQWGAIGDVGLVAKMQEKDEILEIGGTLQQRITSCLDLMDTFLKQPNPIVSSMIVAEKRTSSFSTQNFLETVGRVLGIKDLKLVSPHSTLSELGMDSMLAVEIKQTLENDLQIILTSQEIRDMTFSRLREIQGQSASSSEETATVAKPDKTSAENEPLNIFNFNLIKTFIAEKKENLKTYLKLPSKAAGQSVIFFPGVEGFGQLMKLFTPHLSVNAFSLQFCNGRDYSSVEKIAQDYLSTILDLLKGKKFRFIAYSYGALVALQLAAILESRGYKGSVYIIDSSPELMKQIHKMQMLQDDFDTSIALQYASGFVSKELLLSNQETVRKCKTLEDKIDFLLTLLPSDLNDFKSDLRQRSLDCLARLQTIGSYNFNQKIKSNIVLAKPKTLVFYNLPEDYGLKKICDGNIDIETFDGNHLTIVNQPKLIESIQNWIEKCN